MPDTLLLITAFALSILFCGLILLTHRYHQPLFKGVILDFDSGTQHIHEKSVPRIGGLAIFLSLFITVFFLPLPLLEKELTFLSYLILASIPAFGFGFIEDFTQRVSVGMRLWGTIMAGVIACLIFRTSIHNIGVPSLDLLLANPFFAIAFTAFSVSGISNAMNMIDGLNGLASTTCTFIMLTIAWMAFKAGDFSFVFILLLFLAALIGFLIFNWPYGKIFLGDGGAYFLGFIIAWLGIFLVQRNPQISPLAILVLCTYPISETLFSIIRRIAKRRSAGQPDREHLHQLVFLKVRAYLISRGYSGHAANSLTGVLVSLSVIPCAVLAITYQEQTKALIACFFALALGYAVLYKLLALGHLSKRLKEAK
jgi:UDP-N-acetylmuramyl pentapeptide phosphotransferase/UDP-N-acetylglucosamine-1-phosphate transferase